ncbi:MAG: DUF4153 domain-containing protein [Faecousia sp.]
MENKPENSTPEQQPQVFYYPEPQPVQPPRLTPYRASTRRDMVFALLLIVFSILCADFYFWGGAGPAAGIATVCLILTGAVYLWRSRKAVTAYGCFCCAVCLACALSLVFHDSFKFLSVLTMILCATLAVLEFMQLRSHTDGSFRSIGDVCYVVFALTFGKLADGGYALFHKQGEDGSRERRKTGSVFLGLVIAVPVLLIIVPLLVLSDAAFESMVNLLDFEHLSELIGAAVLGLGLFFLLFGLLFSLPHCEREPAERSARRGVEPIIIVTFLSAVALVYVLYLFSQLAYFFSAFRGMLPEDYSVAEYARRGFFEMSLLCAINLFIIFLSHLLCRKREGKAPLPVRLLCLFLCVFSLILAATSLSKIILYVDRFGMTRLRILTSIFTVLLVVIFLAVILRLFSRKTPYMKISLIAASLLLLLTAYANVDRVIAAYNVGAYQSGKLSSIDMVTLENLDSNAVVPYLWELTGDADKNVAQEAKVLLSARADSLYAIEYNGSDGTCALGEPLYDWRSRDLTTARAMALLEEHFDEYYIPPVNRN